MKPVLTINADDCGYSHSVNCAIKAAFQQRLCNSTTLMANMPAFEHACEMLKQNNLQSKTGIHFVLTEGKALTETMYRCPRFCDAKGSFIRSRKTHVWKLTKIEQEAILEELQAQVERCRSNGFELTHADSHNHIHEEFALLPLFLQICRKNKIPGLRLARNLGKSTGMLKQRYRSFVNWQIMRHGLAKTDFFGSVEDFVWQQSKSKIGSKQSVEVMLHPYYNNEGVLMDSWHEQPISDLMAEIARKDTQNFSV